MKKLIVAIVGIPVIALISIYFSVSSRNVEELVQCSSNSSLFPPAFACQYFLFDEAAIASNFFENKTNAELVFKLQDRQLRDDILDYLVSHNAEINTFSKDGGMTPLHTAVILNDKALVKKLIDLGANPKHTDLKRRLNPLGHAKLLQKADAETDRSEMIQYLSGVLGYEKKEMNPNATPKMKAVEKDA